MRETIKLALKCRDRKLQKYKESTVASIIWWIESWTYKTKKVKLDLETIGLDYTYNNYSLHDVAVFCILVNRCKLKYPIIIDNEWTIIDWRHRVCKALMQGKKTIDAIMLLEKVTF